MKTLTREEFITAYNKGQRTFSRVNLSDVDLSGLTLLHCHFDNSILINTRFDKAMTVYLQFFDEIRTAPDEAEMRPTYLNRHSLESLYKAGHRDFRYVDLSKQDLSHLDLSGADFRASCLDEANLEGTHLLGIKTSYPEFTSPYRDHTTMSRTLYSQSSDHYGYAANRAILSDGNPLTSCRRYLQDYVKSSTPVVGSLYRFFTGAWNHNYIDEVNHVLKHWDKSNYQNIQSVINDIVRQKPIADEGGTLATDLKICARLGNETIVFKPIADQESFIPELGL